MTILHKPHRAHSPNEDFRAPPSRLTTTASHGAEVENCVANQKCQQVAVCSVWRHKETSIRPRRGDSTLSILQPKKRFRDAAARCPCLCANCKMHLDVAPGPRRPPAQARDTARRRPEAARRLRGEVLPAQPLPHARRAPPPCDSACTSPLPRLPDEPIGYDEFSGLLLTRLTEKKTKKEHACDPKLMALHMDPGTFRPT